MDEVWKVLGALNATGAWTLEPIPLESRIHTLPRILSLAPLTLPWDPWRGGAVQGNEGPALTALVLFHNTTSIFSGFSLNPHDPVGQTKAGISSPILQVREWGLQGCYMIGSQVF